VEEVRFKTKSLYIMLSVLLPLWPGPAPIIGRAYRDVARPSRQRAFMLNLNEFVGASTGRLAILQVVAATEQVFNDLTP